LPGSGWRTCECIGQVQIVVFKSLDAALDASARNLPAGIVCTMDLGTETARSSVMLR
jgi:hypothetical protein